jgi:hypothetical protein
MKGDANDEAASDLLRCPARTGRALERQASHAKAGSSGSSTLRLWTPSQEGIVILGGPLGDGEEKFLLIVAADSEQAIEARLADDPWTPARLLHTASVERWEILLSASK